MLKPAHFEAQVAKRDELISFAAVARWMLYNSCPDMETFDRNDAKKRHSSYLTLTLIRKNVFPKNVKSRLQRRVSREMHSPTPGTAGNQDELEELY
jgi:hypothetical protein